MGGVHIVANLIGIRKEPVTFSIHKASGTDKQASSRVNIGGYTGYVVINRGYTGVRGGLEPLLCVTFRRMPRVRVDGGRFVASHKAQNWCATFNNATVDDLDVLDGGLPRINRKVTVRWLARGVEHGPLRPSGWEKSSDTVLPYGDGHDCPERTTPHLQVALQTDRATTWDTMAGWARSYLSTPGHIEPANGNLDDQRRYCSKEGGRNQYWRLWRDQCRIAKSIL